MSAFVRKTPRLTAYVLTNAHRKRVLLKLNAREMYHFARLQADAHAQWDIRELSEKMLAQARKVLPLTLMMACGKDRFAAQKKKAFPEDGMTTQENFPLFFWPPRAAVQPQAGTAVALETVFDPLEQFGVDGLRARRSRTTGGRPAW